MVGTFEFSIVRLVVGLGVLGYAAYSDLNSRMVRDRVWVPFALAAVVLMELEFFVEGAHWQYYLSAIPMFILFAIIFTRGVPYYFAILDIEDDPKKLDAFEKWVNGPDYEEKKRKERDKNARQEEKLKQEKSDLEAKNDEDDEETPREKRFFTLNYMASAALGLCAFLVVFYQITELDFSQRYIQVLTAMLMMVLGAVFFEIGLFRGGADAKAFIVLSMFCYTYPALGPLPVIQTGELEQTIFPFVLVILFNSVILYLFMPLYFLARNIKNGEFGGPAFIGYKMDIDKITQKSYVWLVEKIVNGKEKRLYFGSRDMYKTDEEEAEALKKDLELLKKAGKKRVWVTPQTPFMLPMTIGYALSFFVGNIMFSFLYWLIIG